MGRTVWPLRLVQKAGMCNPEPGSAELRKLRASEVLRQKG